MRERKFSLRWAKPPRKNTGRAVEGAEEGQASYEDASLHEATVRDSI